MVGYRRGSKEELLARARSEIIERAHASARGYNKAHGLRSIKVCFVEEYLDSIESGNWVFEKSTIKEFALPENCTEEDVHELCVDYAKSAYIADGGGLYDVKYRHVDTLYKTYGVYNHSVVFNGGMFRTVFFIDGDKEAE